ncbi:MAG: hypothetical protein V4662_10900 [Verrucomicrobiota bacterium]
MNIVAGLPRSSRLFVLILLLTGLVIGRAQAQNSTSLQQADVARQQSVAQGAWGSNVAKEDDDSTTSAPAAPTMAGDEEYGEQRILLRKASWAPWSFEADIETLWTDNVALSSQYMEEDTYLRTGFRVGYSNRVVGNLFFNASWDYHTVRHNEYTDLDFDLGRGDIGLMYMLPKLRDTFLVTRYSYYRLAEAGFGNKLYDDHVASVGLQKTWKISRGQQIFAGLYADWSTAPEPWAAGRHEYSLFTGWRLRLTDALSVQLSYRGARYQYRTGERQDWNHVMLASASYNITDWLRAGVTGSYTVNRSSGAAFDYENFIIGAGLTAHFEF